MDNMDRFGDDIRYYINVANHLDCKKKCVEEKECYIWTYKEGTCYLKNENTFEGRGDNVISGMKYCNSTGINIEKIPHLA